MWTVLVSWFTVGIVVPVVIGIGVGVLSMTPPHYTIAQVCFSISALILGGRVGWWIAFEQTDKSTTEKALFSFIIFGAIAAFLCVSIVWIQSLRPMTLSREPVPVTVKFKNTAIGFYLRFDTSFVTERPVTLRAIYENISDAPAKDVMASGVMRFVAAGELARLKQQAEWEDFYSSWLTIFDKPSTSTGVDLDGHKTDHFDIQTDPLSEQDANDLRAERKVVHFMGAIKWKDETGEYETTMCSFYRPSAKGPGGAPLWYDCGSGHNETRKKFQREPTPPARKGATITIEIFPVVDLGSRLAYYQANLMNTGDLGAKKVMRFTMPIPFPHGVAREVVDQEFMKFENHVMDSPFGENDIGVGQTAHTGRVRITGLTFQDMLDIQAGTKALYIFSIAKYKDEHHDLLLTKSCISYSRGNMVGCDAHNEAP